MAGRGVPKRSRKAPKTAGPRMAENFPPMAKKAEKFRALFSGDHAAEQGTAKGLASAEDKADDGRQDPEMEGGAHPIGEKDNDAPDHEACQEHTARAVAFRGPREQGGAGEGDPLGHEEGARKGCGGKAQFRRAVDGGHGDHGLDAVVVKEIGDDEGGCSGMGTQILPKGQGRAGWTVRNIARFRRVSWKPQSAWDGEQSPPEADGQKGEPHDLIGGFQTDPVRAIKKDEMDGKEEPAAHVAERIPEAGKPVLVGLGSNVRQKGVVEDFACGKAGIGGDENRQSTKDGSALGARQKGCGRRPAECRKEEHLFSRAMPVGPPTEHRGEEGDAQERRGDGITP